MTKTTPADRGLLRIQEEMARHKLTQRDMAKRLGCSQGRIAKMMKGRVNLRVNDLAALADAVGLPFSEVVRDRGLEFYREMSPIEMRILEAFRLWEPRFQGALLTALGVLPPPLEMSSARAFTVVSTRRTAGRPRKSSVVSD